MEVSDNALNVWPSKLRFDCDIDGPCQTQGCIYSSVLSGEVSAGYNLLTWPLKLQGIDIPSILMSIVWLFRRKIANTCWTFIMNCTAVVMDCTPSHKARFIRDILWDYSCNLNYIIIKKQW